MAGAPECPGLLDIAVVSGFYAQLTGVLAGFAFTAMVLLLAPTHTEDGRTAHLRQNGVLLAFFSALVALVISSLAYSILAGETTPEAHGRASALELINGVPFGLATIMLFYGITLLLERADTDLVLTWAARTLTVVIAPTLTLYYLTNSAVDVAHARGEAAGDCTLESPPTLGVVLSGVLLVILSTALVPKLQPASLRRWIPMLRSGAPVAVLVASTGAVFLAGAVSNGPPGYVLSPAGVSCFLVGAFLVLVIVGLPLGVGLATSGAGAIPPDAADVSGR